MAAASSGGVGIIVVGAVVGVLAGGAGIATEATPASSDLKQKLTTAATILGIEDMAIGGLDGYKALSRYGDEMTSEKDIASILKYKGEGVFKWEETNKEKVVINPKFVDEYHKDRYEFVKSIESYEQFADVAKKSRLYNETENLQEVHENFNDTRNLMMSNVVQKELVNSKVAAEENALITELFMIDL